MNGHQQQHQHHCWGYGLHNGPPEWHQSYPIANGDRQSPIDIITSQTMFNPDLKPLTVSYDSCKSLNICNNGHSVMVEFEDVDNKIGISGGPLAVPYRLKQFHFHWGVKNSHGSEHTVDGKSFPSELHLVHWNASSYERFEDAAAAPDGLAVIGIFLEVGDGHPHLSKLTDALYMVRFKETKHQFSNFNPANLLPYSLDYWTYPGSLTTPPLHESVTWIVFKESIKVSEKQLEKFRSLLCSCEDEDERIHMADNFRPPQPLKGRKVQASFKV
ncbi:carbonic anhydrase 7 [Protopterus annectens]|uniref:carbonic anhydrase 7 n=1 Tax=Protopterus annectens TaxID=7888 RepID=UPI001CFB70DE|nr:carbonic anhydrase 7 [Protopterus annectens]